MEVRARGPPKKRTCTKGRCQMVAKIAYCVKCKAEREMRDAQESTMKNGRPATQGVCPECGTKMFRIGKS